MTDRRPMTEKARREARESQCPKAKMELNTHATQA